MFRFLKRYGVCIALFLLPTLSFAQVSASFVIEDIRVEGLQRVSEGAFFTSLPITAGEIIDSSKSREIIRTLFEQGDFDAIELAQDGQVLVVTVVERPTINEVRIVGNEQIGTEELLEALKSLGLARGKVLNRALLNRVEQDLEGQYYSQGRYGVDVEISQDSLPRNRVDIEIQVTEGEVAKIKQVNIVGNHEFTDEEILDFFQLGSTDWLSFYTDNDQYSKQKLAGDLERLRSFYLDRGFLNFEVASTQVSLTPDKREVFITIHVSEGDKFTISSVSLAGTTIIPESKLQQGIEGFVSPGVLFSRRLITDAQEYVANELGNEGYVFANVNAVPETNDEDKTINLTFYVDPGKRVYVRRIEFFGNLKTADDVLRREMRQLEGGWASTEKIERSRTRLERLGFFSQVSVETKPVLGKTDQIDVVFSVIEQPSGSISAGLGYSQNQGILINFGLNQSNFLGTGNKLNLTFNNSEANTIYNVGFTDPYFTDSGVSQSIRLFYRETEADEDNISDYSRDTYGGSLSYGIPINENDRFSFGLQYDGSKVKTKGQVPEQIRDFFADNGKDVDADRDISVDSLSLTASFSHDTRNRAVFPNKGVLHNLSAEVTLPTGDIDYYKINYRTRWYQSLGRKGDTFEGWIMALRGDVSWGDTYGNTEVFPFYENFFAGGISNLRGFEDNSVGPREVIVNRAVNPNRVNIDDPIGGNLRILAGLDVIFPMPFFGDGRSLRPSIFVDFGHVMDTDFDFDDTGFVGENVPEFDDFGAFRVSTGLAVTWVTQLGPLSVSLGLPLKKEAEDEPQVLQFSFGASF